jgi:GTP cyclohydrolase IA
MTKPTLKGSDDEQQHVRPSSPSTNGDPRPRHNGVGRKRKHKSGGQRRHSMSKAARDPRDEPEVGRKRSKVDGKETRSPSPVIDFDGLSRPSM